MGLLQLAYLVPSDSFASGGAASLDYSVEVARAVLASARDRYAITVLTCGPTAAEVELEPGLVCRTLRRERQALNSGDALSWDLLPALAAVDLVHLFPPSTRFGEFGFLLARLRRVPVCVTTGGTASSRLFAELNLQEYAARVFPRDGTDLPAAYDALLRAEQRAAA